MEERLFILLQKIDKRLENICERLENIEKRLELVEEETTKNAEVASWALKYTPTIDKIEGGLKMLSPSSLLGYNSVPQIEK